MSTNICRHCGANIDQVGTRNIGGMIFCGSCKRTNKPQEQDSTWQDVDTAIKADDAAESAIARVKARTLMEPDKRRQSPS